MKPYVLCILDIKELLLFDFFFKKGIKMKLYNSGENGHFGDFSKHLSHCNFMKLHSSGRTAETNTMKNNCGIID